MQWNSASFATRPNALDRRRMPGAKAVVEPVPEPLGSAARSTAPLCGDDEVTV